MKLIFDYFASMTNGQAMGRRYYTRTGLLRIDTYNRFYQGFIPPYSELASESADATFRQKINPPFPLVRTAGLDIVRTKSAQYPTVMLANESGDLNRLIYSTDLWHFYSDGPTETDMGVPNGTPTENAGIDAVIFNSKILTSHPLDGDLYHASIAASPSWTGVGSFASVVKILKVIEDQCLVLDSSQGSGKPRDRVKIVKTDFSVIDGFAIGTSDFDIQDIQDYEGRFALLFARKTSSDSEDPLLSKETTVFLWDVVPGDSYDLKLSLPGIYQCSITKNGVVYAFTQVGSTLKCFAFNGSAFQEVGSIRNVVVSNRLAIPRTRVGIEGDYFVILASSPGNTSDAPFYWNPSTGQGFFLTAAPDSQAFESILYSLDPATNSYRRYFAYQNATQSSGTVYACTIESDAGDEFLSDLYGEENQNSYFQLSGSSDAGTRAAQSFTAMGGLLDKVTFSLAKDGSPTGTMLAKLYAHSGTFGNGMPTGSALATSDTLDITTLGTDFALFTFSFSGSNQIQLTAGAHYFVSFEYASGDSGNRPKVGYDSDSPSHPGNAATFLSPDWTGYSALDLIFYLDEILPSTATYKSNAVPAPAAEGVTSPGDLGRLQIDHIEIEFNAPPPTQADSIIFTLTTKDEFESETYLEQTATVSDTTAHSTDAAVDAKRAIIQLGGNATEIAVQTVATLASPTWDLVIRRIVVVYEPIVSQL